MIQSPHPPSDHLNGSHTVVDVLLVIAFSSCIVLKREPKLNLEVSIFITELPILIERPEFHSQTS